MSVSVVVANVRAGRLLFVLLYSISCSATDVKLSDCAGPKNKTSYSVETCPPNSTCTLVNGAFKCLCLSNLQQNTNLDYRLKLEYEFMVYCQPKNATTLSTVLQDAEQSTPVVYNRPAANVEHLVFTILVVLLSVILAVVIIYLLKRFKLLKITKVAYVKLKRRGNKHQQLMEDVYDEIPMTRHNEDK